MKKPADTKALDLLNNSPYKDKLGNAGLFLKALQRKRTRPAALDSSAPWK